MPVPTDQMDNSRASLIPQTETSQTIEVQKPKPGTRIKGYTPPADAPQPVRTYHQVLFPPNWKMIPDKYDTEPSRCSCNLL